MDSKFHPDQVADRWVRAKRALKTGDQGYADSLAGMIGSIRVTRSTQSRILSRQLSSPSSLNLKKKRSISLMPAGTTDPERRSEE